MVTDGQSGQNPVQNAIKSLQDLSKRANRRGSKFQQSQLQQMLFGLIQQLQNLSQGQPQADPGKAGFDKMGAQSRKANNPGGFDPQDLRKTMGVSEPTSKANWYDWNVSDADHKKLFESTIKKLHGNLCKAKIDSNAFVEWYLKEGVHHESVETLVEDFGQWAHGLWGGVKGLLWTS